MLSPPSILNSDLPPSHTHTHAQGYSVYADSAPGPSSQSAMMQRCNLHSTMVLKALHTSTPHNTPLSGDVEMETGGQEVVSLKLRPSQLTRDQVTTATSMYGLLGELSQWDAQSIDFPPSQSAVGHMMPGGSMMTTSGGCGQSSLSQEQQEMMFRHTTAVSELLRHFWSCFPVRTPQLEDKVCTKAALCPL